jgi:penicillin-binding protein 2
MIILDANTSRPLWRFHVLIAMMVCGMGVLVSVLGYRQLAQGDEWTRQMAQSSLRVMKLPSPRGLILDRNGDVLVDNKPSYNVALFLDEFNAGRNMTKLLRSVKDNIKDMKARMKMPVRVNDTAVTNHYRIKGPLPLTVWTDLSPAALAAFEERSPWNPGVDLDIEPVRVYPFGPLACHVLGYVGKPETEEEDEDVDFDSVGRRAFTSPSAVGKAGIEAWMDAELQGIAGRRAIRLNAAGLKETEIQNIAPTPGKNVVLSIDREMQMIVEEVFTGYRGACVLLDPRNGDVLAMASVPSFNPNMFVPAIRAVDWRALQKDQQKPLINRAIQAMYSPGSSFKVIAALAGLESGAITTKSVIDCPGFFSIGGKEMACWEKSGHGPMKLYDAITMSCNVFFYNVGQRCGSKLVDMASAFGLGQATGIPLDHESAGLLPSDAHMRRTQKRSLSAGDFVNMAIGQGTLNVTPLQMAVVAEAFANGGTIYKPRLVLRVETAEGEIDEDFPPAIVGSIPASPEHIQFVREAMLNVVENGTGRRAGIPKVKVAAKTGSAQFTVRDRVTGEAVKQTRAWMIAFMPYEDPKYAIAIIAEGGEAGGTTVGPFVGTIFRKLLELEQERGKPRRPAAVAAVPVNEKIEGLEGEASGEYMDENVKVAPPSGINDANDATEAPPQALPAEKVQLP